MEVFLSALWDRRLRSLSFFQNSTAIKGALQLKRASFLVSSIGQGLVKAILEQDGTVVITADHGNAELMEDSKAGQPHTAHTTSRVPFIFVSKAFIGKKLRDGGILGDIAPTILEVQGLPIPKEMTGQSLFF